MAAVLMRLPMGSKHTLFLSLDVGLVLADVLWRRRCRGKRDGGSYARWREAMPLLLVANHTLLGARDLTRAWLEQVPWGQGGGAVGRS